MSSDTQIFSHQTLREKYFYPVNGAKGAFVATNHRIPHGRTPAQMIMDRETCVVYLVDASGNLYMQPAEMFPKEILNAPLWKTIPLPKEDFYRIITPTPTPSRQLSSPHPHQQGYSPSLATYLGEESSRWQGGNTKCVAHQPAADQYYVNPATSEVWYVQQQAHAKPDKKHVHFAQ